MDEFDLVQLCITFVSLHHKLGVTMIASGGNELGSPNSVYGYVPLMGSYTQTYLGVVHIE